MRSALTTAALNVIRGVIMPPTLGVLAGGTISPSATYATAGTTARGPQGPFIHGKPFVANSRVYLPSAVFSVYLGTSLATSNPRTNNSQNTFFLFDCGDTTVVSHSGTVVAKALYGSYGVASINANPPTVGTPCSSPNVGGGNFITVSGELTLLVVTSTAGLNVSPTGLVRLTMNPNAALPPIRAQLGESAYLAGGALTAFDGSMIGEHGFPLFPEGIGLTVNGAGSGAMTAGVHQVVAIYEWW